MASAVLVLNSTYEAVSWTRLQRAVSLVVLGHAVIEEAHPDKVLHRPNGETFPWPVVLRMLRFVKVPFNIGPATWSKHGVMLRDKGVCAFNPKHRADTVDHIMPTSRGGGARDWKNTVAACTPCNNKKDNRTPEEASMIVHVKPYVPSRKEMAAMRMC